MKIPTASAPNGPYYHGPPNGMELNPHPQWQGNGVILEAGPPGNGGPYMVPHHVHPAGFAPPGGFYQGVGSPGQPQDFSEYMWMENEEEFDKQVMQQLEEEALMEQCIEAMLADEREALGRGDVNLEEAVSKSTLNPLAAEFVPTFLPAGAADADIPTVSSRGTPEAIEAFAEKTSESLSELSLSKSDDAPRPAKDTSSVIDASPATEGVKTNNVSKAVKALEAVIVVSAIDGLIKEDKPKFEKKSDVERKRSSESVKKETAAKKVDSKEPKKVDSKEPKKVDAKEPVKRVDSKESVKKVTDSKEAVKKVDSKEAVKKVDSKEAVKKVDSKESVKKVDSKESVKKVDSKESVKKVDSKESVKKVDSKESVKKVEGKEPLKKVDSKEAVKKVEVKRTPRPQAAAKVVEKQKEEVVIDLQGPPLPSVATPTPVEVEKPQVSAPAVFNYAAAARANLPPKAAPAATSAPPSKETTPIASSTATSTTANQAPSAKPQTESANKDAPRNATSAKTKPTEKGGVKDDKRPFKSVGAVKKGKK